ncbi:MAG: hypothetical protein ACYDCC_04765 [Actinomycetota bacterium]
MSKYPQSEILQKLIDADQITVKTLAQEVVILMEGLARTTLQVNREWSDVMPVTWA